MIIHVLGTGGGAPRAGGACPGYLVEAGGQRILLDCGPGVVGRLFSLAAEPPGAVVVSHLHPDHFLDLFPLAYYLFARCFAGEDLVTVPLYLPAGSSETFKQVSRALGHGDWALPAPDGHACAAQLHREASRTHDPVLAVLPTREYAPGDVADFGDGLRLTFASADHGVPAGAIRVESGSKAVVYSGDTTFTDSIIRLSRNADLAIFEATRRNDDDPFFQLHLSAREAGEMARLANARRLVLTHLNPFADRLAAIRDAQKAFSGPVSLAEEGNSLRA